MTKSKKLIVISLGGSLVAPEEIDAVFIKNFRDLIIGYARKGFKFIIVCGGGKTARKYQGAAKSITRISKEDADWLGILATRINAFLLKSVFGEFVCPNIIENPLGKIDFGKKVILFSGGWKPGRSTDYLSVLLAKRFGADKILNLTNIDYVYDKDPKKFKDAKRIKNIHWKEFRKLIPKKWSPGLNAPFDPIASKEAEKTGLEVAILNGKKLKNIENYLNGKNFIGTLIKNHNL